MDVPGPRRVLLTLGLLLAVYALLLPVWLRLRGPYARATARAATVAVFPALGIHGRVTALPGGPVALLYSLPDARTGGVGQCRQRLLNFPDLPLALAAAAAMVFLSWRRRLVLALLAAGLVFAGHLALIGWSAGRMAAVLARPGLSAVEINMLLPAAGRSANEFGDVSPVLILLLVPALALLLSPRASGGTGRSS